MMDAAELKNHVYDIVGALHSVHDELGPGINEYIRTTARYSPQTGIRSKVGKWARAS